MISDIKGVARVCSAFFSLQSWQRTGTNHSPMLDHISEKLILFYGTAGSSGRPFNEKRTQKSLAYRYAVNKCG